MVTFPTTIACGVDVHHLGIVCVDVRPVLIDAVASIELEIRRELMGMGRVGSGLNCHIFHRLMSDLGCTIFIYLFIFSPQI